MFKASNSFQDRVKESKRIMEKYPDKIPVICERNFTSTLPKIDKHKYLVPMDLTIGQFIYVIRKRIKITPQQAIYLFIKGHMPPSNEPMNMTYSKFRDEDGFLYISYTNENTFGRLDECESLA
jgi:GABA(A) receptor-associated protein